MPDAGDHSEEDGEQEPSKKDDQSGRSAHDGLSFTLHIWSLMSVHLEGAVARSQPPNIAPASYVVLKNDARSSAGMTAVRTSS